MDRKPPTGTLTPRQRDILALLANNMTQREVAEYLGIDRGTVRTHMQVAYRNIGVKTAIGAFIVEGWLVPPPKPRRFE